MKFTTAWQKQKFCFDFALHNKQIFNCTNSFLNLASARNLHLWRKNWRRWHDVPFFVVDLRALRFALLGQNFDFISKKFKKYFFYFFIYDII